MSSRPSFKRSQDLLNWALVLLSVGAVVGIGAAAAFLGRRSRLQPDDPDAPLFI